MRNTPALILFIVALMVVNQPAGARKIATEEPVRSIAARRGASDNPALADRLAGPHGAASAPNTTVLLTANFNAGANCSAQGWTSVDLREQAGAFWHVDDYGFIGLPFGAIEGAKSLWCGLRPDPQYQCSYQTLPGYGNGWNQSWCTKACVSVAGGATPNLDVSFTMRYDTEPSYDATMLEYLDCADGLYWIEIDGGNPAWTGQATIAIDNAYAVSGTQVKVRLRFLSDGAYSDQDGIFPTDGAVHIDNLKVEDLDIETFEDELVGATASNDWQSCNETAGNYAGLFKGASLLQEDECQTNLSCMWAFIQGSTDTYACGGHPEQIVVPFGGPQGMYIENEIWSPLISVSGLENQLNVEFDVYRDLPINNLVFYTVKARAFVNDCPTDWKNRVALYDGDNKDWFRHVGDLGGAVNLVGATHVQVALGVRDMCAFWCGLFGSGACHSHAPLFDNVKVYHVDSTGPHWTVRDIDLFQDTFAADGTITGTARADMARDIRPRASPSIGPGDSAIVLSLVDPEYASGTGTHSSGLSDDPDLSTFVGRHKTKKQAYLYVAVWPLGQPGKSGAPLSEGPGGQANRYPFSGTVVGGGVTWTRIRMDYTYSGFVTNPGDGDTVPVTDPYIQNRFNVDLNDALFTPGDTICYFFGATSPGGTTYYSDRWLATDNIEEVAANPMEFTILPAGGYNRGGDILYVDGADGLGNEPYFEGAFMVLGLNNLIDRYDVRGPSSGVGNRLAGRVVNVAQQLNAAYEIILWDTGSLPVTLGDGSGDSEKTDDYALLNSFLGNLSERGGVYLCGDDLAEALHDYGSASAVTFRFSYMPFTLLNDNHRLAPTAFAVSPTVAYWPGRAFTDNFFLDGGCPVLNDFDVVGASGASLVQMSYHTASSVNGAVLSHDAGNAGVLLSGFSFAQIRDDETDGVLDRAGHLYRILTFLGDWIFIGAGDSPPRSSLAQNYPNPFNPTTTIAFSIAQRAHVSVNVYDVGGRLVRTLANETRAAGPHHVTWDGRDGNGSPVASGVYFYRLVAGDFTHTRKMLLLK